MKMCALRCHVRTSTEMPYPRKDGGGPMGFRGNVLDRIAPIRSFLVGGASLR